MGYRVPFLLFESRQGDLLAVSVVSVMAWFLGVPEFLGDVLKKDLVVGVFQASGFRALGLR